MDTRKRKLSQNLLGRRVRARAEPEPEPDLDDFEDGTNDSAPSEDGVAEEESGSEPASDSDASLRGSDENGENGSSDDEDEEEEEEDLTVDAAKISFGALAKAQAMLPQSNRRKKKGAAADEDNEQDQEKEDDAPFSKSLSSKKEKPPSRSSKHAPMEMTSKRPVSRKREIIPVKKMQARDPRFDPMVTARSSAGVGGGHHHSADVSEDRARRAYAFLDEYRDDEMQQLKAAIKKAKNPADKEKLQRALMSMASRKRAREQKDREKAVVEEHRRRERELVREGKKAKPFYLKKSEQRKRLLVGQFTGMSEKQREKAIEKKRKKVAAKEKKELPTERRMRE